MREREREERAEPSRMTVNHPVLIRMVHPPSPTQPPHSSCLMPLCPTMQLHWRPFHCRSHIVSPSVSLIRTVLSPTATLCGSTADILTSITSLTSTVNVILHCKHSFISNTVLMFNKSNHPRFNDLFYFNFTQFVKQTFMLYK